LGDQLLAIGLYNHFYIILILLEFTIFWKKGSYFDYECIKSYSVTALKSKQVSEYNFIWDVLLISSK
jgi:hypothetical protein